MFVWDYSALAAFVMTVTIGFVLFAWLFYTQYRSWRVLPETTDSLYQCPFCFKLFFHYQRTNSLKCPCCLSLLDEDRA